MNGLRDAQMKSIGSVAAFHDFQFTDRLAESGITFRHRIVDDAGKTYKAAHYDHGNGLAIADVDGDGLLDIYFVNQVGGNQLWKNLGGGKFEDITASAGVACRRARSASRPRSPTSTTTATPTSTSRPSAAATCCSRTTATAASGTSPRRRASTTSAIRRARCSSTTTATAGSTCSSSTSGATRRTRSPATGYKYYVAFEDAFSGHLKPERAERSILYRNEGGNRFVDVSQRTGLMDTVLVGRRQRRRRQRRRLARSLRAEHAGRRSVLRERRRQALRQEEPPGVPADVVGLDGHQGVRLQQRRPARHLHHRHALRHERADRPGAREAEVGHEVAGVVPRHGQDEHLGQLVLPEGRSREVPRSLRRARRRELLSVGTERRRPERRRVRRRVHRVRDELSRTATWSIR